MKTLDPNDLRCCFCDKPIQNNEVVAVIEAPGGLPAVSHMDHTGVREMISHPCQITTGALLRDVAAAFNEGIDSDAAFDALTRRHAMLTETQRARLKSMGEDAQREDDGEGDTSG
jgi:hypothetical protein